MYLTRRRKRILLRAFAVFILVGAIFPNVTHIDHWGDAPPSHTHELEAGQTDHHANHCHGDSSQCSSGLSMVSTYWIGDEARMVSLDAPVRALETSDSQTRPDSPVYRTFDPPRAV